MSKAQAEHTPDIEVGGLPPQVELSVDQIVANQERNLRRYEDDAKSTEALARDIVETGQIQPVVVRYVGGEGPNATYELIAGFRRYKAIKHAIEVGGHKLSVLARVLTTDDHGAQMVNLKENVKRKNLSYIDMGYAIQQLRSQGLTTKELAAEFNMGEDWVRAVEKLMTLPPEIQKAIHKGEITFPVARVLVNCDEKTQQRVIEAAKSAADIGTNVQKAALDAKKKAGKARKSRGGNKASKGGGVSAKQAVLEMGETVKEMRAAEKPNKAETRTAAILELVGKYLTGKLRIDGLRTKIADTIA